MFKMVIEGVPYILLREDDYTKGGVELKESAKRAISSLTCLELDAARGLFNIVDTVIDIKLTTMAEELKISKSLVSSMIKKLENNNIVESSSIGVKGTRIKILNQEFKNMIKEK